MPRAEDRQSKARWYKGLVRKYDRSSDRYLVRPPPAPRAPLRFAPPEALRTLSSCSLPARPRGLTERARRVQIIWETGGQDWVDELKDNEYKMAKPPAQHPQPAPQQPAPQQPQQPAPHKPSGGAQKRKRSVKEAKILVYGLPNSGKTSIINKLADQVGLGASEEPAAPTHMFNVNRMHWNDVRLTVFDFGGKTEWRRSLWKSYFDQADALVPNSFHSAPSRRCSESARAAAQPARRVCSQIWVVDSTDRTHLETCREELLAMLGARFIGHCCCQG